MRPPPAPTHPHNLLKSNRSAIRCRPAKDVSQLSAGTPKRWSDYDVCSYSWGSSAAIIGDRPPQDPGFQKDLDRGGGHDAVRDAVQRSAVQGADRASPKFRSEPGAIEPSFEHQDRRLSGGLRLLQSIPALRIRPDRFQAYGGRA